MNTASLNRLLNEWRVAVIGVAALIVLTGLAYFAEVAPILRQRENFQRNSIELNDKRQALNSQLTCIRSMDQQIKTLTDRQSTELKLEPSQQINDRLSTLASLASAQGLVLESTEPGNGVPQGRYSTISIHITGHGRFPQCVKFVQELRQQLPDVAVNNIGLTGGADGTTINFNMNLIWYAAPEPAIVKTDMN